MTQPAMKGGSVYGRKGTRFAKVAGRVVGRRLCTLESCGGERLAVRWPDGHLTWPCSKGMTQRLEDKAWQIL
jgi:hypothetical protein